MRKLWNSVDLLSRLGRRRSSISVAPPLLSRDADQGDLAERALDLEEVENPKKGVSISRRALYKDVNIKPSSAALSFLCMGTLPRNSRFTNSFKSFSDSLGFLDWQKLATARDMTDVAYWEDFKKEDHAAESGESGRDYAEACVDAMEFEDALPYCLKSLEIHQNQLGQNSVEVARDRKLLAIVYSGLEEHDKALEQDILAQRILKNGNLNSDFLQAEIDTAKMMIVQGRHDEAVCTLKSVIQQTDNDSQTRALVLITMAKALWNQEKFADCKSCLEISLAILNKRERISPVEVAEAYTEISMQYETMKEFEAAISLLRRALALLQRHPHEQQQHSQLQGRVYARIGWLLLLAGKVQSAIFYLEGASERLHFRVGYVYYNLGVAYLKLDRPQTAAELFEIASEQIPYPDRIEASQNHSKAQFELGRHDLAIDYQTHLIRACENLGPTAEDKHREACQLLEQLRKKERGAFANANELPMKLCPYP